jgi:hypothetical protein
MALVMALEAKELVVLVTATALVGMVLVVVAESKR